MCGQMIVSDDDDDDDGIVDIADDQINCSEPP